MKDTKYLEIIKAPIITEKAEALKENGQYCFRVSEKASKPEIKEAIEKLFNVHVKKINTINIQTKKKRVGRYYGRTNHGKKAIVTLAEGETIDLG